MLIKTNKPIEVEVNKIKLDLPIRYEDEDIPFDFPCRVKKSPHHYGDHDRLILTLNIETGEILNPEWPANFTASIKDMKVCDEGIYTLLDVNDNEIAKLECYVPSCVPNEYGDYVNLEFKNGFVDNWRTPTNFQEFFSNED